MSYYVIRCGIGRRCECCECFGRAHEPQTRCLSCDEPFDAGDLVYGLCDDCAKAVASKLIRFGDSLESGELEYLDELLGGRLSSILEEVRHCADKNA